MTAGSSSNGDRTRTLSRRWRTAAAISSPQRASSDYWISEPGRSGRGRIPQGRSVEPALTVRH